MTIDIRKNVELSITLAASTFLDPRFTNIAFSSKASSDHAKKIVTSVLSKQFETSTEKRRETACLEVLQLFNHEELLHRERLLKLKDIFRMISCQGVKML
ncbi:hypothetical protein PR048_010700 [Dryococelus australis]|uniref:Uncharacterized protein n=1 Tax=Dryococelus australis TaxID=614101 RepID=A0ABQ9I3G2_9NEOP|nr:hypothetical protein PR048_010700 [Dryococelus australis]